MGYIIGSIILIIILWVALGIEFNTQQNNFGNNVTNYGWKINKKQWLSLLGFIVILFGCFTMVNANQVGVLYDPFKGGIQDNLLQEGYKVKSPFAKVYKLSTEVTELTFEGVSVQTSDSQWIKTILQVQVQIDNTKAFTYFKNYRDKSFKDISNILKNSTQKQLETVTIQYNVMDILGDKRDEIANQTLTNIQKELGKNGIIIQRFILVDTDAGNTIENAITKEAAAKKEAEAAKWLKEKATEEGQAKVIGAQKEKEANELLTKSLTNEILTKMFYEKWDGKLPIVYGNDGNIIDISKLLTE
ncbi:MAG: SPFH domain-containing protein [Novosphingobium sp.]|nr:SPFH domain-containing protein [Novosphingobium sp.]